MKGEKYRSVAFGVSAQAGVDADSRLQLLRWDRLDVGFFCDIEDAAGRKRTDKNSLLVCGENSV